MRHRFVILASFATALTVACGSQGMRKGGDGAVATGGAPDGAVVTGGAPDGAVATGGAPGGGADALVTPDSARDVKGTGGTAGSGGAGSSDASVGSGGAPAIDGPTAAPDGTGMIDGPTARGGSGGSDGPPATGGTGSGGIPGGTSAGGWGGVGGVPVMAGTTGTVDRTPGIASFSASPPTIGAGQSSTLRWVAYGATTLSIDQGVGSVLGATSVVVTPAQTTTYTLSWNGTISAQATVTVASAGFWATGSMAVARTRHTATLLSNGKVLIAGGLVGYTALASAELYDPDTGTFTPTGSMTAPRGVHTATLLHSGKVLMVGGGGGTSTELYDPDTGTFTVAGNSVTQRYDHTATLLQSGAVLIAGGYSNTGAGGGPGTSGQVSAELYDPAASTFTATGNLTVARERHAAIPLPSGTVFIAGGFAPVTGLSPNAIASTEQYDPKTGVFAATGNMTVSRCYPTATLLLNGAILLGGGQYGFEGYVASVSLELYDPATRKFVSTGTMNEARAWYTATLLPAGSVLIAGGYQGGGSYGNFLRSAELYDPAAGKCTATGSMAAPREFHTATLLANGTVLIAGGDSQGSELASAELYK